MQRSGVIGRSQILIAVGIAFCVTGAAYYGVVAPAMQQIVITRATIGRMRKELTEQRALRGTNLRDKLHEARVFSPEEASGLASDIADMAASAGAQLSNLTFGDPKQVLLTDAAAKNNRYKVHKVEVKAKFRGSYASILKLMETLEGHNPPIALTGVSMRSAGQDASDLDADLSASVFVLLVAGAGGATPSAVHTQTALVPAPGTGDASPFESPVTGPGAPTVTVDDLNEPDGNDATPSPSAPGTEPVPGLAPPGLLPGGIPPPTAPPAVAHGAGRPGPQIGARLIGTIAGADGGLAIVQVGRRRYSFKPGDLLSANMQLQAVQEDAIVLAVGEADFVVRVGQAFPEPVEPIEPTENGGNAEAPLPSVARVTTINGTPSAVVHVAGETREVRKGQVVGNYVVERITDAGVLVRDVRGRVQSLPFATHPPGG